LGLDCLKDIGKDIDTTGVDVLTVGYVTTEMFESTMKQVEQNFKQILDLIGKISVQRYNTFETHFGEIRFTVSGDKEQFDDMQKYMNSMSRMISRLIKDKTLDSCQECDTKKVVKFDEKGYN